LRAGKAREQEKLKAGKAQKQEKQGAGRTSSLAVVIRRSSFSCLSFSCFKLFLF
jgi:hypothetical protein